MKQFNPTGKNEDVSVPKTEEECKSMLRQCVPGYGGEAMVGIFEIRILKGESLLDAYQHALEAYIHAGEPTGKWKCRACGTEWYGKELFKSTRDEKWTCGNLSCGGICEELKK